MANKAASKGSSKAEGLSFTDREIEIMQLAFQAMEVEPKINFHKLAELAGMTNVGSASNAWNRITRKLKDLGGDTPAKSTKPTPASKKRGKAAATEDDNNSDSPSKSKRAKRGPAKKNGKNKAVKQEESASEAELTLSDHLSDHQEELSSEDDYNRGRPFKKYETEEQLNKALLNLADGIPSDDDDE